VSLPRDRFAARLALAPLLADGGMGTLLFSRGIPQRACLDELATSRSDLVGTLHREYLDAGADLVETLTFGANRFRLDAYGLAAEAGRFNRRAAQVAREARDVSGRDAWVGGSIGPLGPPTRELRHPDDAAIRAAFREQIDGLLEGGADVLVIETFFDLHHLLLAVDEAHRAADVPVIASMTFGEDLVLADGTTPEAAVRALTAAGVDAIGVNCGVGPLACLDALARFGEPEPGEPARSIMPNAGLPQRLEGRFVYAAEPAWFGSIVPRLLDTGARIVGGCCGTTPAEIAAIRRALDEERAPRAALEFSERELHVALGEEQRETDFQRALHAGEFVLSVQLDPPLGGSSRGLLELAETLRDSGHVRFVDVNDNATARAGMSSLMVSGQIERECRIETIPHLTTRDWTVLGLESILLGAHAEGVRNVLAITGDPPEVGDYPGSQGVYELDAIGLTRLITRLNRGEDYNGRPIDAPTSFFVGVAVNPTADDLELEADRFRQKIEAGAKFAMTQIVFDLEPLDRFAELIGGWPIPVLAGVFPVTSHRLALRLHNEVPGILVPQALQDALADAGADAAAVGMAHARELLQATRERCAGAYVVAPYRRPSSVLDLLA